MGILGSLAHRDICEHAGEGEPLLAHEAVANHDYALGSSALGKVLRIPRPQVAVIRLVHLLRSDGYALSCLCSTKTGRPQHTSTAAASV